MSGVRVHPKGLCESDDVGEGTRVWAFHDGRIEDFKGTYEEYAATIA